MNQSRLHLSFSILITSVSVFLPISALAWSMDSSVQAADASFSTNHPDEQCGSLVFSLGDINADGFDDVGIGLPTDDTAFLDAGRLYIVLGHQDGWQVHTDLLFSDVHWFGEAESDGAGYSAAGGGDLNGDAIDDLLISAPWADPDGVDSGKVYIILGDPAAWPQASLLSNANGSILGEGAGSLFGSSLAIVGDVDGDGLDDFISSSPDFDEFVVERGRTFLFPGQMNGYQLDMPLANSIASFAGEDVGDFSGSAVAGAGDMNGDGFADFAIGAPGHNSGRGMTYLVFGHQSPWALESALADSMASYEGEDSQDASASSLAGGVDVNGDALDDLIVGAPMHTESELYSGAVYLILGRNSGWQSNVPLSVADVAFYGEHTWDNLGASVASIVDFNADGIADFAASAPLNDEYQMDAGQSYLILGRTSGWNLSGSISDANASFWGAAAGDEAGTAVASGDFDGDGYYDFLIGAPLNDENGPDAGISYVAFGGECVDWDSDGASLCDDCDDQDVELNLLDVDEDGVSSCDGDCDDLDATIHPLAVELCDEADGDCDGIVPADEQDADGDGYLACEECDDSQPEFFPGGVEICDGQDNDCDGELPVWDQDFDGDGASVCEGDCDDADAGMNLGDLDGDGFSSCDGDCDEGDGAVFPGAVEVCDGIDGDCDGDVPEEEMDEDGDGMMPCAGDCDDQNPGVYSGGEEVCDGLDNDCNGVPDDRDVDGDGFVDEECGGEDCDDGSDAVSPGASEVCGDGLDNDCNGLIDEADGPCSGDDDTAADDDSVADDDDESPGESGCKCGLGGTGGRVSLGLFGLGIALLGLRFRRRWNGFLSLMLLSFCCAVLTAGCGTTECDDDDTTGDDDDGTPEPGGQIDSLLELDLGPVYLGETGSATLEIRNTGEQPLVVTDIFVSGSETDTFTIEFDQELEIVADSDIYYPLQVTFDPESAFRYKATLVVISSAFNAPPGAPHQVMLVGQGVQDQDGDGFAWGDGYEGQGADCDDENGAVNPDAQESCDGIDNDCDGGVDDVPDGDGDGVSLCDLYPDCDDTNPYVHPVWVDPDATGGNGTEDLPYGSIDDALGEQNCGFVLLREGRYFEGHRLEVTSAPLEIVSVDGPLAAEIHGSGNHGLFSIHAGPVAFSGLLFQGGHEQGQAGGVEASADISFDLCAFRYNESDADAGAVSVAGGELVIENSNLFMNRGSSGGGIFHDGSATGSGAEIRSCSFVANTGDFGAGAFLTGGEATVESSQFLLNEARYGGGAWIENATLASITASQFHGNATPAEDDSGGAGLVVADTLNLLVEGSLFSGNTSQLGGGALVYRTTGAFEGTSFQANQANFLGGALYLEGAYIEVSDCSFADNSAETAGGAVHARDDNILSLHRTTLLGNQAEQGGAIAVDSGSLSITNSVLDANGGDGAALYFDGATLSLEFTTLYDNQGPEDSAAVVLVSDPSLVDLRHSILADSVPAAVACEGESMAWDYNAYHSTLGDPAMSDACLPAGTGSMDADPWFIAASPDEDPYNDTLQLQAISPCIDAGDPTCLEADGTVCDMGAYGGTDPL